MSSDHRTPYLFVSYASADRERALALVARLEAVGVDIWIDRHGIHGGANYAEVISDAIKGAAALLLVASPAALASRNVRQELALGWRYEKPYLPLLLDPVVIPDELAYWLEGSQWIEVLDHPAQEWLNNVATALRPLGITLQPSPAREAPAASVRPLVVGREREQGLLRDHLDRMLAGNGSLVLVGGEAGIGKTTLVEDLSARAEEAGALVLWGHAYDLSVTPPYGPWLEIFRQYRGLTLDLPPLPPFIFDTEVLAKVGSQEALFAQVADFLRAVAAQRPLLLVLDDLHWFDQASLDFLRFLARQVGNQQLVLVATYRSDELHRHHPLYTLVPLLVREAGAQRVDVRPMTETGHRALIQLRYQLSPPDAERLALYLEEHAEGNPLYAGELLRTLEDEGVLTRDEAGWVLGDLERVRVPPLLRQVIEARLARLPESTRELLDVAAIIGQAVTFDLWATVAEADESRLLEAAEAAAQTAVLEVLADGSGARFRHALLREALYENVLPLRRRLWHRKTAEALAQTRSPDPDRVAHHFQQAGDERAVAWLIRAGERARRAYVWATAVERFDAALAKLTEQQAPARDRVGLLMYMGLALRYADPRRAVALFDETAKVAAQAGAAGMMTIATFLAGLFRCNVGEFRTGLPMLLRASEAFNGLTPADQKLVASNQELGGVVDESSMAGSVVLILARLGRLQEASTWSAAVRDQPVPELSAGQVGSHYADGLSGCAVLAAQLGQPEEARRFSREAATVYRNIGHLQRVATVLGAELRLVQLPYFPEELSERRQLADSILLASRQAQGGGGVSHLQIYVLPLLWLEGAWETVREIALRTQGSQNWEQNQEIQPYLGQLAHAQGDVALAQRAIASVLVGGPTTSPGDARLVEALSVQRLAAQLALDSHDSPAARTWLEAHDHWLDWSGAVFDRAEGALGWARYHQASGDLTAARQQAEQALAHASDPRQPLALMAVHRILGQLETEAARFDAAEEHLHESLRLADACQAPFERSLTLLELARLRAAQGRADDARRVLAQVRALCEPLEAKPTLERVAEVEQQLLAEQSGA
ncbi:MAG TPA: AAA family ATPase [Thermomicrobiaceae bacterium]|nr:AAA family ATPase [Thermomicrobiaceae bacterium]